MSRKGGVMQRYMCMNCGCFFNTDFKFDQLRHCCPACGDLYVCDNIDPAIPPIEHQRTECRVCGQPVEMEFMGDINYCPHCNTDIHSTGKHLVDFQDKILDEIEVRA